MGEFEGRFFYFFLHNVSFHLHLVFLKNFWNRTKIKVFGIFTKNMNKWRELRERPPAVPRSIFFSKSLKCEPCSKLTFFHDFNTSAQNNFETNSGNCSFLNWICAWLAFNLNFSYWKCKNWTSSFSTFIAPRFSSKKNARKNTTTTSSKKSKFESFSTFF